MSQNDVASALNIAKAGLRRFFDEGHYVWTKKDFIGTLQGVDVDHPEVQDQLKRWEKMGAIRLLKEDHAYLEVMGRIPD